MKYWVISEKTNYKEEGGSRWIAFPATDETLEDVKKIAGLFDSKVYVAIGTEDKRLQRVAEAENDCRILALRLCGEDETSFAPETAEVMARWKPRVLGIETN